MLPYQAVAMDYAGYQRQTTAMSSGVGMPGMGGVGAGVGAVGAPFSHSWFVPADLCVPYKQSHVAPANHLEPGILELRKEKSRDAARSRRGKENYEFYELAKMLPLPAAITSQLDKASIIRLTISYLKLRDFSGHGDPPWSRDGHPNNNNKLKGTPTRSRSQASLALEIFEQHQGTHILQSLDGFALSVAADGRFLYISETVSIYLGLSQVEMTGSSIFDYIHHGDHAEIADQLGLGLVGSTQSGSSGSGGAPSPGSAGSDDGGTNTGTNNPDVATQMTMASNSQYKGIDRAFCVRMKSTLTKRGCHFKSSGYRVVLMLCRLRAQYAFSHARKSSPPLLGMVALAIALPPPSVHEIRLEQDMFVTRINFDFRIAHCEPKVSDLLDYTADEMTGKNLYSLCHGEDASKLRKCHVDLINKGQVLTHYYRLMNKNGGYTWMQTCATVVCSSKNADEQNIICVNYVLSGKEDAHLVLDSCQLAGGSTVQGVKREEAGGGGGDGAGSPGADPSGTTISAPTPTGVVAPTAAEKDSSNQQRGNASTNEGAPRRAHKRKHSEADSCCSSNGTTSPTTIVPKPVDVIEPDPEPPSVKDLEHAMSKHLPAQTTTDFSTDALLKQQQKSSTIQWIGAHHAQAQMPASALLRQLYANRESVIRATTRPAGAFYEGQSTPPGSDGYSDAQFAALQKGDAFSNLVSSYGGYHSADYHSAMTPPSSVSPRDKPAHVASAAGTGTSGYEGFAAYSAPETLQLPLKPQAYPAMHGGPLDAYGALEQSQFYSHHGGFHLYHKGSPASGWYSAPS